MNARRNAGREPEKNAEMDEARRRDEIETSQSNAQRSRNRG